MFHDTFFFIKDYLRNVMYKGHTKDGLYCFLPPLEQLNPYMFVGVHILISDWHSRLGYASSHIFNQVLNSNKILIAFNKRNSICLDCEMTKSHNLPFHKSIHHVIKPLELIFSYVWEPSAVVSNYNARYYICFLDYYTNFICLFPLKQKSKVENIFL